MSETQRAVVVNDILLCGDIHPQPGPSRAKRGSNETTIQGNKSSTNQAARNRKHLMLVAHLNVRSIASRETFHLLKQTVTDNNYDIFTISESWLDPTVSDADIRISGYGMFRQDQGSHKKVARGGLLVYVKNIYMAWAIKKWSSLTESNFQ